MKRINYYQSYQVFMGCGVSGQTQIMVSIDPFSLGLSQAEKLEKKGQYRAAVEKYKQLLQTYPDRWEIYAGLGTNYRFLKQFQEAILWDKKGLEKKQNAISANSLSISYRNLKNYEQCQKYANMAIRIDPKYPNGYNSLGQLKKVQKKTEQSIEHFRDALKADPSFFLSLTNITQIFQNDKRYDEAIHMFKQFLGNNPNHAECLFKLSLIYKNRLKQNDEALVYLKRCIEKDPSYASAYNTIGNIYLTLKREEEAIQNFKKAIELKPRYSYPYNGWGNALFNFKRYRECIDKYTKAIEIDNKYSTPYSGRGDCFKELGQLDRAIEDYSKCIELNPKDDNPYNGLGNVYKAKGHIDESIKWIKKAIEINPRNEHPYNGLGNALISLNRPEQSIQHYKKSIEVNSNYAYAYNGLANAYSVLNNYPQAEKWYKKCIEVDPKYDRPYTNLGNLYKKMGRNDEALVLYLKSVELNPKGDAVYNSLGLLYHTNKQYTKAIESFQKATQNNSNYALAEINFSLTLITIENYPQAFKHLKLASRIVQEKGDVLDVFGGCKTFIKNQLESFEKEIEVWQFKCKLGYLAPEDKKRIDDMRKMFEQKFKTIFSANESTSVKLDDLDHNFFLILQKIKEDAFKLLNDAQIAKINYDLFKDNNDNFNILAFLFCKFFWTEKNNNQKSVLVIEKELDGKLENLCKLYPPSSSTANSQTKVSLKKEFPEKKVNLFKEVEYFKDYMYLVKEIENIQEACKKVLPKFKEYVYRVSSEEGGYNSKANLKLPDHPAGRFKVYIRIMEKMFKEIASRKEPIIQIIENKMASIKSSNMQTVISLLVETWTAEISTILTERKEKKIPTQCFISDLVRGKAMFRSVEDIQRLANRIIDDAEGQGFEITEIDNRLGKDTKDLVFKICIEGIVCELQLALQADSNQYNFSHSLYEIKRSPLGCIFGSYLFLSKFETLNFYSQAKEIVNFYSHKTLPQTQEKKKEAAKFLVEAFTESL